MTRSAYPRAGSGVRNLASPCSADELPDRRIIETVRISDLKARLSEHLRKVRRGRTLTVLHRDTAIARIIPYDAARRLLTIRSPRPGAPLLRRVSLPPALRLKVNILALLAEQRQHER